MLLTLEIILHHKKDTYGTIIYQNVLFAFKDKSNR